MPLPAGTRFGPYEILSPIGAGGMGEVYKARDTRLDRIVAIKVLPEHHSRSPQVRERFEREAHAIASLSHPHICTLHDVGHQDGIDFLVMEYLEGETLAQRLRKGPLPLDQVLREAIEIVGALDQAHRHGITHRDLKPGNIMLTKSGTKLLDFGLAKLRTTEPAGPTTALPTETAPLTAEGAILGTLQYMAPEQLEGIEADARTDIFAMGEVIYEAVTGHKAFEGKSQASLISSIMTGQPPPVSELQPLASAALDRVVAKCLAKDPEERWQSARDLETDLKWIAAGGPASQLSAPPTTAVFRKRELLAWIVAGCFLIALIAAWVILHLRQAPDVRAVRFDVTLPGKGAPVVSPDGQYVAVIANGDPQSRIWLHPLNSLVTNPLPGTEGGQFPFWSPDSRQIGFSTASALKRISLAGGTPQNICNLTANGPSAWNRDGVILFWPGGNQPLYQVNAMGGEPKALTKLDGSSQETGHLLPAFLPDGRHFTYLSLGSQPATYLGSLDSPEVRRIHEGPVAVVYAPPGYLIFVSGKRIQSGDGTLVAQPFDVRKLEIRGDPIPLADSVDTWTPLGIPYGNFSVSENGVLTYLQRSTFQRTQLVWFDRTGKRLGTVGAPAQYSSPAISPDQKKVAVGIADPQTRTRDIWVIDFQRGSSSRLTFDPGDDLSPTWSPDGTLVAFSSDRKGSRDIYVKPASGVGEERVLMQSAEMKNPEDWSADGQYLLYENGDDEGLFWFREQKSAPLFRVKFDHAAGRFFPNGSAPPRWIAYHSSHEAGTNQVYVCSFAGALSDSAGKWQISTSGGSEPYWRGDGKELFYTNGNKLMAVEVNPNGKSFEHGIPKELFETPLPDLLRNRFVATSDGKRFLMNVLVEQEERAGFTVVLNWPAGLKR